MIDIDSNRIDKIMAANVDEETILQGRDLQAIFQLWEKKHSASGFDPEAIITR